MFAWLITKVDLACVFHFNLVPFCTTSNTVPKYNAYCADLNKVISSFKFRI